MFKSNGYPICTRCFGALLNNSWSYHTGLTNTIIHTPPHKLNIFSAIMELRILQYFWKPALMVCSRQIGRFSNCASYELKIAAEHARASSASHSPPCSVLRLCQCQSSYSWWEYWLYNLFVLVLFLACVDGCVQLGISGLASSLNRASWPTNPIILQKNIC